MRARLLFAVGVGLAASSPASAFVRPYVKETLGSGQYYGTTASVDAGADFHVKPQFSSYHSSTSSGTFNTYSLKLGYDFDRYGLEVSGGMTPTVNNYNNHFFGGAASISFDFDPPRADSETERTAEHKHPLVRRLDFRAGLTQTVHREIITTQAVNVGNTIVPAKNQVDDIGETDVEGSGSVTLSDWLLSVDLDKSVYEKDLARIAARGASVIRLAGLLSTIQGFPDINANVRAELDRWLIAPYVSYTYTTFKVTQPLAVAYTAGAKADWDWFGLDASYQRYAQKGAADINYYGLAARLRF